jgi:hypothetical protein
MPIMSLANDPVYIFKKSYLMQKGENWGTEGLYSIDYALIVSHDVLITSVALLILVVLFTENNFFNARYDILYTR